MGDRCRVDRMDRVANLDSSQLYFSQIEYASRGAAPGGAPQPGTTPQLAVIPSEAGIHFDLVPVTVRADQNGSPLARG